MGHRSIIIWSLQQLIAAIINDSRSHSLRNALRHRKHRIRPIHKNLSVLPDKQTNSDPVLNQLCAAHSHEHLALGEWMNRLDGINATKLWNFADDLKPILLVKKLVWELLFANGCKTV